MQKRYLIIFVVVICLITALAGARPVQSAGKLLSFAASLYAPENSTLSSGTMTFGNEYLRDSSGRSIYK